MFQATFTIELRQDEAAAIATAKRMQAAMKVVLLDWVEDEGMDGVMIGDDNVSHSVATQVKQVVTTIDLAD